MKDNQLELLDVLNILSFLIGVMNLQENLTQGDKQELLNQFGSQTKTILGEIHNHLEKQDKKIDSILKRLEAM